MGIYIHDMLNFVTRCLSVCKMEPYLTGSSVILGVILFCCLLIAARLHGRILDRACIQQDLRQEYARKRRVRMIIYAISLIVAIFMVNLARASAEVAWLMGEPFSKGVPMESILGFVAVVLFVAGWELLIGGLDAPIVATMHSAVCYAILSATVCGQYHLQFSVAVAMLLVTNLYHGIFGCGLTQKYYGIKSVWKLVPPIIAGDSSTVIKK